MIKPVEPELFYIRQGDDGAAEICVGYGDHQLAMVYRLRPSQLIALAADSVALALPRRLK